MSLFDDAASDWQEILNDDIGATVPCTVTNPSGVSQSFLCRHMDISQQIDPETEEIISGRQVGVSIDLKDLAAVSFDGVCAIEDKKKKPWKVTVANILGTSGTYKVAMTSPDFILGNMLIYLETME